MFNNALLMAAASAAASVPGRYVVDYGCRFDRLTTSTLAYTPGSAGNRRQITFSYWQKRCLLATAQTVTFSNIGANYWQFGNPSATNAEFEMRTDGSGHFKTDRLFRDPTAWFHVVLSFDTERSVSTDRMIMYVNGKMVTDWGTYTALTLDTDMEFTNTTIQRWGNYGTSAGIAADCYLSQLCMIDGQALDATSFGEFDNGVWRPIDITGLTFGTTGYLLDFADSSDLGKDVSGNDNDFTSSGLATDDQVTDTPTDNFATLSSIDFSNAQEPTLGGVVVLSNGLLNLSWGSTNQGSARSTFGMTSGKYYTEVTYNDSTENSFSCGVVIGTDPLQQWPVADNEGRVHYDASGVIHLDGSNSATTGLATFSTGDVIGMQVDMDASPKTIEFFKNGVTVTTQDLNTSFDRWFFSVFVGSATRDGNINFGQLPFAHTPEAGFKGLSTANLPEPTIKDSKKYFDTILYVGNGAGQKVGQFQPITESYSVDNSALFIEADSCFLYRTNAAGGSTKRGTFSFWAKRGSVGSGGTGIKMVINCNENAREIQFNDENQIRFLDTVGTDHSNGDYETTRHFVDRTQWGNYVFAWDTTLATAGDRFRMYYDGVEIDEWDNEIAPDLNSDMPFSRSGIQLQIGANESDAQEYDGYLADFHFIDSSQLTASSFGEVDSTTNRWIPKAYSGAADTATITFLQNTIDMSDGSTYTFSSQALGAAASDRVIVCFAIDGVGSTATAVTIGGVSATLVQTATTVRKNTLWYATVPTGTTGDVVVTGAAETEMGIALWRLTGVGDPYDFGQSGANPGTATLSVPAGGVVIGGMGDAHTTYSGYTWTGLTENFDEELTVSISYTGASATNTTAQDLTVSCASHAFANSGFQAVSFGPSGSPYGTNGFHLDFADKNDLGDDESGNTNDFTESGFDTTNGSNQFYDTPTRNFATFDPGFLPNGTLTLGNLLVTAASSSNTAARVGNPFGLTSGKYYWEFFMPNGATNQRQLHIIQNDVVLATDTWVDDRVGTFSGYESYEGQALASGNPASTTAEKVDYGDTWTSGDVISCAVDLDIGAIWWGKNGTWQASATEAEIEAGNTSKAAQTGLSNSGAWFPLAQTTDPSWAIQANFGQHIYFDSTTLTLDTAADGYFRHAVPDGFKALNVDALTESDSFQSGFSWIKNRDASDNHMLFDRVRGIYKDIHSNASDVEVTNVETLQRFLKQGATIGEDVQVNTLNENYVYWDWFIEATGSGSSNEDGTINTTSTLVDTTGGISISTYTGTGVAATIGHGLGVAPSLIIVKCLNDAVGAGQGHFYVYHKEMASDPETDYMLLNTSAGIVDSDAIWNDTAPTSTVFSIGTGVGVNESSNTYISYAFAEIEGYSNFGKYSGNSSSTSGTVIHTGFRPALIIAKRTNTTGAWIIHDSGRSPFNVAKLTMATNESTQEYDDYNVDFLANGFKWRDGQHYVNLTGSSYVYIAFAQNPFGGASTTPSTAV